METFEFFMSFTEDKYLFFVHKRKHNKKLEDCQRKIKTIESCFEKQTLVLETDEFVNETKIQQDPSELVSTGNKVVPMY